MKIMILSNYDDLVYVESVRDAGAKGYLLKDIESEGHLKAITKGFQRSISYSNEIALKLLESSENQKASKGVAKAKLTN